MRIIDYSTVHILILANSGLWFLIDFILRVVPMSLRVRNNRIILLLVKMIAIMISSLNDPWRRHVHSLASMWFLETLLQLVFISLSLNLSWTFLAFNFYCCSNLPCEKEVCLLSYSMVGVYLELERFEITLWNTFAFTQESELVLS